MAMVQKEDVMKTMDQMLSSLDLLEMNIGIRMNHALKDKSEKNMQQDRNNRNAY